MASKDCDLRREAMRQLARQADRVCSIVLMECYPDIDVVVAVENLRETASMMFPGREGLFDMIYLSRFRRLWQQFRGATDAPF